MMNESLMMRDLFVTGGKQFPFAPSSQPNERELCTSSVQGHVREESAMNGKVFMDSPAVQESNVIDEPVKTVFKQVVPGGQFQDCDQDAKQLPPAKKYHMSNENNIQLCPVVHGPTSSNKRRKVGPESSLARCLFRDNVMNEVNAFDRLSNTEEFPTTRKITKKLRIVSPGSSPVRSVFRGKVVNEVNTSDTRKGPEDSHKGIKISGILSLIDKMNDIDAKELHKFLSELDWS